MSDAATEDAADLDLLVAAAAGAAEVAMRFFRRDPQVWWKPGNSPVSEADLAVDRFLHERLGEARPGYGWVSEETATVPPEGGDNRFFLVDPIDGTRAYLRGEDTWCVALAVIRGGRPVAAVIDARARGEVYASRTGGGAALNGRRLDLANAVASGPLRVAMPDELRRKLGRAPNAVAELAAARSAPSLAYRLAEVAAGAIDGTLIRPNANDWDIAAGDLILSEAGGRLADAVGEESLYKPQPRRHGLLVAGSNAAWPQLQALARAIASP